MDSISESENSSYRNSSANNENTKKRNQYLLSYLTKYSNYENLKQEELIFENFLNILKKSPKERSSKEIEIIAYFLRKTDLNHSVKSNDCLKLMCFCAINIEYFYAERDSILFKEGDIGDSFYLLLEGNISVYKDTIYSCNMNAEDYLLTLYSMYVKGKMDYINLTISANLKIFQVNKNDIKFFKNIIVLLKYRKLLERGAALEEYKEAFSMYEDEISDIQTELFKQGGQSKEVINYITSNLNLKCKNDDSINKPEFYNYINDTNLKLVYIHDNQKLVSFSSGKVFGEIAFDNKNRIRTASIKVNEDSHLGKISQDIYNEFIMVEKQKIINNEIEFLLRNYFFNEITLGTFRNRYFYNFVKHVLPRGLVLFKEKENCDKLFFIREGEIELKIEISLLDLIKMINNMVLKTRCFKKLEKYLDYKDYNSELQAQLSRKRVFRFLIIGKKEVIGNEALCYNIPYFYEATVNSKNATVYIINSKVRWFLNKSIVSMLNEEKGIRLKYNLMVKSRIKMLLKQLHMIKKTHIKLIENSTIARKKNEKIEIIETHLKDCVKLEPHVIKEVIKNEIKESNLSKINTVLPGIQKSRNIKTKSCNEKNYESKHDESYIEKRKYDKVNKSITSIIQWDKILQSTMRFSIYDDTTILSLPKISAFSIKASSYFREKSSIFDKVNDLRSFKKINFEEYNLDEVIKIPLRELKNLGNKKIIKEVNRNKENVATLTKLSHINKPLMDEHRFRHLYIIKENKKTNQHKYIK